MVPARSTQYRTLGTKASADLLWRCGAGVPFSIGASISLKYRIKENRTVESPEYDASLAPDGAASA
jgi:hypothetical protein